MSEQNLSQNEQRDQEQNSEQNVEHPNVLETCKKQVNSLEEQIRYLSADFENYRRNSEKDRGLWYIKAQGQVLTDILQIVDDFDRAFDVAHQQMEGGNKSELASWLEGFSFIRNALEKILAKYDVTAMEATGEFDPERHEALQQVESPDHESGSIVSVIKKGYLYKGTVLRTAQVIVAK